MNLFLNTINGINNGPPPIWMMRQAGRYHQHYQNLRAKHSFMDLCLRPELAAEVAMGPIQDFDFDAAILFSDILFPLMVLGQGLEYTDQGPRLGFQLDENNFDRLKPWREAVSGMEFQRQAVELTRSRLSKEKGLIGFVGGPWTLFVYAVEGSHAGSLIQSKKLLPTLWPKFSEMMVPFLIENIRLQFQGGVDVAMIFDTAAGELSPALYEELILPKLSEIVSHFPKKLGYYAKGVTMDHVPLIRKLDWAGIGLDHRFDLSQVLKTNSRGFVQGNFDQSLLHMDPLNFAKCLKKYLEPFKNLSPEVRKNWVCGLGHGVLPKTPEANVRSFVEIVRREFL